MDKKIIAKELLRIAGSLLAVDKKYQTEKGTFKKMTPVDGDGKKNKFNGCVRYQISQGYSQESAEKICGKIKQMKG